LSAPGDLSGAFQIAHHTLGIFDPARSLAFYQQKLGMTVRGRVETISDAGKIQHYFLNFDGKDPGFTCNASNILDGSKTLIELVHRPDSAVTKHVNINADKTGY
jgi:catechol 2,3-dioxygenase-like lactoylglutathione lyase family enzyme